MAAPTNTGGRPTKLTYELQAKVCDALRAGNYIETAAAFAGIAKSTLYKLTQEGRLPGQKVGRHWRFRKETIDRWLDANGKERR